MRQRRGSRVSRRGSKGQSRLARARASVRSVSWLGCLSFLPGHNKQTEAAAGPACHPGGRRGAERSGGQVWQGAVSFCPHLICAAVGSLPSLPVPQGRIEHMPERQKPLRGHPLTAVPNRLRAARLRVCLSVRPSVCPRFLTASTRTDSFEPVCQDKLTSPIYAPISAKTRDRSASAAQGTGSLAAHRLLLMREWPLLGTPD